MKIYGPPEWSEEHQSCSLHGIPMLPCPQCLAEKHPGIIVVLDKMDHMMLDWEPDFKLADMMPADYPWLVERIY